MSYKNYFRFIWLTIYGQRPLYIFLNIIQCSEWKGQIVDC